MGINLHSSIEQIIVLSLFYSCFISDRRCVPVPMCNQKEKDYLQNAFLVILYIGLAVCIGSG